MEIISVVVELNIFHKSNKFQRETEDAEQFIPMNIQQESLQTFAFRRYLHYLC